jgi:adenosylcobinamide-GDP ribazoletransferase
MWADMRAAFSFLTILPFGYGVGRKPGGAFAWFPLVGLIIGGLLAALADILPDIPNGRAFVVLLAWVIVTGGLHLDGFGDSCDGLLATVDPARRLEIMKDPRTGTWAVVGLILLLSGKWSTLDTFPPIWLIVPPVIGRWVMVLAVWGFPYARSSGMGGYFREGLGRPQVIAASVFTAVALFGLGIIQRQMIPPLIGVWIGGSVLIGGGYWAKRRLGGGLTGDVYGAMCELSELLCVVGISLWANG